MIITPIKTHKITTKDNDILTVLDTHIKKLQDKTIVVITSKIISLSQGNVVPIKGTDKDKLIAKEADAYIPREENKYHYTLTIKNNILIPAAGIDKSNTKGNYVLWPKNPQECKHQLLSLEKKTTSNSAIISSVS